MSDDQPRRRAFDIPLIYPKQVRLAGGPLSGVILSVAQGATLHDQRFGWCPPGATRTTWYAPSVTTARDPHGREFWMAEQ